MKLVRVRPSRGRRSGTALAAAVVATSAIALGATNQTASAAKPTAAVAMGDSFISGEGAGNYLPVVDFNGRKTTFGGWAEDNNKAFYCHRSPNAEVAVASLPGISARFNVACSGAHPNDISKRPTERPYGRGFSPQRQVAPQLDQLRTIAKTHDIDLVVINIGANNRALDFGGVTSQCMNRFANDAFAPWSMGDSGRPCWIGSNSIPKPPAFKIAQQDSLDAVRAILRTLDQIDEDGQHRVVLQDYINPFPAKFDKVFERVEKGNITEGLPTFPKLLSRRYEGGCPIHIGSLEGAEYMAKNLGSVVQTNANILRTEFPKANVTYLSVQRAFDGVKLCERNWGRLTPNSPNLHTPTRFQWTPNGNFAETLHDWSAKKVKRAGEVCQGLLQTCQESLHPNAKGHKVLGQCLTQTLQMAASEASCQRLSNGTIRVTAAGSTPVPTPVTPPATPPPPRPDCDLVPTSARRSNRADGLFVTVGYSQAAARRVERLPVGCP